MPEFKVLAIAVSVGRIGYVLFKERELKDWRVNERAARSTVDAAEVTQLWVSELQPTIVVTERCDAGSMKGDKSRRLIRAIASTVSHNMVLDISVIREQHYQTKYEEAKAYASLYPDLAPWLPTERKPWDSEPRNSVLIDALSLAHRVIDRPTTTLAAAMD